MEEYANKEEKRKFLNIDPRIMIFIGLAIILASVGVIVTMGTLMDGLVGIIGIIILILGLDIVIKNTLTE
ncbi:MAG: hypothetical protein ACP6IU_00680 [Candidatus Asgardarchaeia archaeon]